MSSPVDPVKAYDLRGPAQHDSMYETTAGRKILIDGKAGQRILVQQISINSDGAQVAQFQSSTGGGADTTDLTAEMSLAAKSSFNLTSDYGVWVTENGDNLEVDLANSTKFSGSIVYFRYNV